MREGRSAEKAGRSTEALEHYRAALAADPACIEAHLNLGMLIEAGGDTAGAQRCFEAAVAVRPENPFACYNLGRALYLAGDVHRAKALLRTATRAQHDFPEAHVVLASVLVAEGDTNGAVTALGKALALRPGYAGALRNLGALHSQLRRWPEAATSLAPVVAADAADAEARCWLGNAQMQMGHVAEAVGNYRSALHIRPEYAEAHWRLGNALAEQGARTEAESHVRTALAQDPSLVDAHVGLGNLMASEFRYAEAAACYRSAIDLAPSDPVALANLGVVLAHLGEPRAAATSLDQALAAHPEHAAARWARALCGVPAVRSADDHLATLRADLGAALASLRQWIEQRPDAGADSAVGVLQPFWLAYQEEDNLPLLKAHGELCARVMGAWQQASGLRPARPAVRKPVRVGIVSQHFRRHSVWNALIKGWLQGIDPARVELIGFSLGAGEDDETRFARSRLARFVQGPRSLRQWGEAIVEAAPHALIYPEVGMDATTLRLASMRLASVQAAAWGHPETTGLPTIDYYLSASELEPKSAQTHYCERLLELPGLGCYLEPEPVRGHELDLAGLGLPEDVPLLLCPGSPYKYAPENDAILALLARRLQPCRLVFFRSGLAELTDRLQCRLEAAFRDAGLDPRELISFIPWQNRTAFHALMRRADLMLDTLGFSGFNTALQAVECELPLVTCEGRFLRGRLASGILRRVGVHELIAADEAQYVELAVRLTQDAAYRTRVRARMAAGRPILYRDTAPIRALEGFLQNAARG